MSPIAEILFGGLDLHAPKIYVYDGKWTPDSAAHVGTLRRFGSATARARTGQDAQAARWPAGPCSGSVAMLLKDAAAAAEAGLCYKDLVASIVESSLESQVRHARN